MPIYILVFLKSFLENKHTMGQRSGTNAIASMALVIMLIFTATTSATPTNTNSPSISPIPLKIIQRDYQAGSSCSSEGQWNCMGTSWQRCAAGQWSVVMQCAENTQCTPSGLSYDFAVEYKGGGNGAATSGISSGTSSLAITGLLLATLVVFFMVHW